MVNPSRFTDFDETSISIEWLIVVLLKIRLSVCLVVPVVRVVHTLQNFVFKNQGKYG